MGELSAQRFAAVIRRGAAYSETNEARFGRLAGSTIHGAGNDSGASAIRIDRRSSAQAHTVGGQVRRGTITHRANIQLGAAKEDNYWKKVPALQKQRRRGKI